MKQTIAIIHFNTPELTEACIMSIRKHGCDWPVVVFDNSADITAPAGTNGNDPKEETVIKARPFRQKMKGVKVIDNTKGQVIDFEQFLSLYPDRNPQVGVYKSSVWGSAKHIVTVQKLWELLPDGFILVESDTLVKRDITELWKEQYSFCGYVQRNQNGNRFKVPRILPMLCYMNVPKLTKEGARYFDPDRCWGLKADANLRGNWFDTGACLLDDVLRMRPRLKGLHVDIRLFIEHYGGGSWHQGDLQRQSAWLKQHEALWAVNDTDKIEVQQPRVQSKDVAVCIIVRCENPYLREWCDHYLSLGVKKIFLYDNSREGDERPAEVLTGYGDAVEIIDYTKEGIGAQVRAYTDCYEKHGNNYGWIGFLDADELVKTDGYYSLPDYLDAMQADVVLLSWRIMTDSGLVHYDPRPMAERFTVAKEKPSLENGTEFVKSFVRGGLTGLHFEVQPHVPSFKGKLKVVNAVGDDAILYPAIKPVHKVAWIDHYLTKTAEEYIGKINRGFINVSQEHNDKRKATMVEDFFNINERTPEKEEILGVKPSKKTKGKAQTSAISHQTSPSKPKTTKRTNSKSK
jgi:hypothetical protein